ncbi:MAG: 2-C-methyl-D-erythritol 4-phosphate cytidylyltransferase [Corynebacterium sp.]|nr:2-C-methyl-D-erythritol 4-phosphate cytidylyltransferase [Corynebacterium sp.]
MTSSPKRVFALVAAAGQGTRLGAPLPKAFVPLLGRTLLERSVTAMETASVVDQILVAVSDDMSDIARRELADHDVIFVAGGKERVDSVWNGLQAIPDEEAVVLVHDAARALTPPGMIARVARKVLDGYSAVIPVLPVADTIKSVDGNGVVTGTPPRANLRAVQTPQGFDLAALREANRMYMADPFPVTDDASLVEAVGGEVVTVPGDPMAFKITTPLDFALAERVAGEAEPTIFTVGESA